MLTDTKPLPCGSRTHSLSTPFSLSLMHLHLLHSFPITGTPEVAATIHNLDTAPGNAHVYMPALLLVEGCIVHHIKSSVFSHYPLFLRAFSLPLGDRPVELPSTRSRPISRAGLILADPFLLFITHTHTHTHTHSWTTLFTLAAPIFD
jgi:hypothetical protein